MSTGMKHGAWVIAALVLSACAPSSPDDARARQALEAVRTGQLDAVTAMAAPDQLQTPAFADQLFRTSSQFPGYPPEDLALVAVETLPQEGRTQLTYHYTYADEIVPANVILTHSGGSAQIEAVTLDAPIPVGGLGHFFRHLGVWAWVILGAVVFGGAGIGWRIRQIRARKLAEQARKARHERRRRRHERRKRRAQESSQPPVDEG